jgi:hypothetical protein
VMLGEGEEDARPLHPLISHVRVPPLAPASLTSIDSSAPAAEVTESLSRAAEASLHR